MGRPKNSKNGVITTYPVVCKICENIFQVLGKHKPGSKRPIKYCSQKCYHISKRGQPPAQFITHPGGAPKGRVPWNKGIHTIKHIQHYLVPGFFGMKHTTQTKQKIGKAALIRGTVLRNKICVQFRISPNTVLGCKSTAYRRLFRIGWKPIERKAMRRDNFQCSLCRRTKVKLSVHHKIPFNVCHIHELSNLITLCYKCHNAVHAGKIILQ